MTRLVTSMKFEGLPQDIRVPRGVSGKPAHDEHVVNPILPIAQSELADLITLAVRVGRGTETQRKLGEMLRPYGIRRKS